MKIYKKNFNLIRWKKFKIDVNKIIREKKFLFYNKEKLEILYNLIKIRYYQN